MRSAHGKCWQPTPEWSEVLMSNTRCLKNQLPSHATFRIKIANPCDSRFKIVMKALVPLLCFQTRECKIWNLPLHCLRLRVRCTYLAGLMGEVISLSSYTETAANTVVVGYDERELNPSHQLSSPVTGR